MYGYAAKKKPEEGCRSKVHESISSPAPVSSMVRPVIFEKGICSHTTFMVPVIQCIRKEELQNQEGTRRITISSKESLHETREDVPSITHPILAEKSFQEAKSSTVSELTTATDGAQYLQLGWDNCILLQRIDGKYLEAENWRMDYPSGEPAMVRKKTAVPAELHQGGAPISRGQAVDALVTWSVSSCEIVILVSSNKDFIAMMHINNDISLPAKELAEIQWQTAFVSIIDQEDEIARTKTLLDSLQLSDVRILDRKFGSEEQFDVGSDSLNYIGLNLSDEAGPQIFGSQGSTEAELLHLLQLIMTCNTWAAAKATYLTKFYSMSNYLDNFLRSMISPPPLADKTPRDRATRIEKGFKKLKGEKKFGGFLFRQFRTVFLGIAGEQGFQIQL